MELDRKYIRIRNCAKAMDLWPKKKWGNEEFVEAVRNGTFIYNPAVNYAEALQLVERYYLTVTRHNDYWSASPSLFGHHFRQEGIVILNKNICEAITECASQLYQKIEDQRIEKEKRKERFKPDARRRKRS